MLWQTTEVALVASLEGRDKVLQLPVAALVHGGELLDSTCVLLAQLVCALFACCELVLEVSDAVCLSMHLHLEIEHPVPLCSSIRVVASLALLCCALLFCP
jgi:hypothetical protein